ncbi:hypothetical protein R80B4_00970 [Fibrobacteres bacterium R8-0-B4]
MRKYTVADVLAVKDILSAAVKNGSGLDGLMKAGGGAAAASASTESKERGGWALASYILNECLANCQELLVRWLASLNEMTVEEFNAAPPQLLLDTVEAVYTSPESADFFSRASQLYRKITA